MNPCKTIAKALSWFAFSFLFTPITSLPLQADEAIVKSIDVQYVGTKAISKQRILSKLSTRVGQPLSVQQVDQDIKNLHASGEVMNVQFLSDKVPGGVALIVVVESRPLHGGVRFEGNTVFPDKKLGRAVEFAEGQPIDESAIRKARQEILNLYHKRGYGAAAVDYEVTSPNARGYSQVVFRIDEKAPELLRRVQFVGNTSITSVQLKEVMKQKERGLQNLIGRGGRTDAESIADDVRSIEDHYRDNGFFRARVARVAKVPVDGKFNDLVFTIDEGRSHNVTGITIDGVNAFSAEKDLAPYLKSKSGKPFSGDDLQDDIKMITDYYRSRGYIDARVVPVLESPKHN